MSKFSVKLSLVILLGSVNLGLSSVAQADMKWFETINGFCPTVCQGTDYKFAVPSGIHPQTGKTFYVCSVQYARTGWRVGYNIEWRKDVCYAQWIRKDSGKNSYSEHYFCLCADTEIPLITDDMVRR
jgi:hypothetical protein